MGGDLHLICSSDHEYEAETLVLRKVGSCEGHKLSFIFLFFRVNYMCHCWELTAFPLCIHHESKHGTTTSVGRTKTMD